MARLWVFVNGADFSRQDKAARVSKWSLTMVLEANIAKSVPEFATHTDAGNFGLYF